MKGAIAHVTVYVVVHAFLVAIWALTRGDFSELSDLIEDPSRVDATFWPIWSMLGWGVFVVLHVILSALALPGRARRAVRDREHRQQRIERKAARRDQQLANRQARRDTRRARHGRALDDARHVVPELPIPPTPAPGTPASDPLALVRDLLDAANPTPRSGADAPGDETTPASGPADAVRAAVVTVLFTDLVGSTTVAESLGDATYAQLLIDHRRLVREVIASHDGREVGTQGDGFLVAFADPASAVDAAATLARRVDQARLHGDPVPSLRMGLHGGEVMTDGDDLLGTVVNLAARVCAAATPGEILVTEPVADRLGSGAPLVDKGLVELKGLRQRRHLFALDWPATGALSADRQAEPG